MKLSREVKISVIAIFILAITVWGYNFLKGKNILAPTNEYYVAYNSVEGLIESGAVYYHGFQVGSISEIIFDVNVPDQFLVRITLRKDLKIPKGTKVVARTSSLIASAKDLELQYSDTNVYHNAGDTLLPAYDGGMMDILTPIQTQLESVVVNLNTTLESLNNTLNTQMQNDLHASIASLKATLGQLAYTLSANGDLGKSLNNVEAITGSLAKNSDAMGETLNNLSNITASIDSANIEQTLLNLDSTLVSMSHIMAKIDNAEGSAGLMVNDSALYTNLAAATASLDSLLVDLKENPKRYVHLSVFGGKDK